MPKTSICWTVFGKNVSKGSNEGDMALCVQLRMIANLQDTEVEKKRAVTGSHRQPLHVDERAMSPLPSSFFSTLCL